jgi:hypothetical protein
VSAARAVDEIARLRARLAELAAITPAGEPTPAATVGPCRSRALRRGRNESIRRLSKRDLERGRHANPPLTPEEEDPRPATLAECLARGLGTRDNPCARLACTQNLALDVHLSGAIQINAPFRYDDDGVPDLDLAAMTHTCALQSPRATLEEIGAILGVTGERVRQIETQALDALRVHLPLLQSLREPDAPAPWRWDGDTGRDVDAVGEL